MKVTPETIARTIVLILALCNQVFAMLGKGTVNIAENDIYQVVTLISTIAATLWAWWKNNSFTQPAIEADEMLKELKQDKS